MENKNYDAITRRKFITQLAIASGTIGFTSANVFASSQIPQKTKIPLCIFSKHLQWLNYKKTGEVAKELGFDGVALTVRPKGHVLPERVEDDFPKAVEEIRNSGMEIPMIVTRITDPNDPKTEKILSIASKLGIRYYRLGYFYYDQNKDILKQLNELKPIIRDLATLSQEYNMFAGYHNHTGRNVGGQIWDTWNLFKELDPESIGFQFDSGNAFGEGAGGSWRTMARLAASRTKMLSVKTKLFWGDTEWQNYQKKDEKFPERLYPEDLIWSFRLVKEFDFSGPLSVHYEFPGLGGAERGKRELTGVTSQEVLKILRQNLNILRKMLATAKLL